jgi:hypothetical protein
MFGQTLLVALLAGLGSALLSGALTPGSVPMALLVMLAPLPLFITGFGWHALAAALGGLIAMLLIEFAASQRGAIAFAGTIALPTYAICYMAERLFAREPIAQREAGNRLGLIALAATLYAGIVVVAAGLYMEPDYARTMARVRDLVTQAVGITLGRQGAGLPPGFEAQLVPLLTELMLPMTGFFILFTLVISGTLGIQITDRSRRLPYRRPDFRRFRLPGGALILLGLVLFLARQESFLGLFAAILLAGLLLLLMLQGVAVIHARTAGKAGRGLILTALWMALIVLTPVSILFIGVGIVDHLIDLRRGAQLPD